MIDSVPVYLKVKRRHKCDLYYSDIQNIYCVEKLCQTFSHFDNPIHVITLNLEESQDGLNLLLGRNAQSISAVNLKLSAGALSWFQGLIVLCDAQRSFSIVTSFYALLVFTNDVLT